ncbi:hypothetical protein [Endozoicomonas numazuensis]|uniref:Uncharacterized protein n=1 Tax=Endozoicomonas numazuensis TaxID=1137799 RepID=A0A081N682_9GAMM|nr:hypothetical protein [Endozoicomonas numazuensis]KEQ13955.1 hypothetical protein GZ78_25225 [Endozoicomonas numazuensis]
MMGLPGLEPCSLFLLTGAASGEGKSITSTILASDLKQSTLNTDLQYQQQRSDYDIALKAETNLIRIAATLAVWNNPDASEISLNCTHKKMTGRGGLRSNFENLLMLHAPQGIQTYLYSFCCLTLVNMNHACTP